ncbi:MAG: flap endonuclease [Chloroflexi bacterium]|nr:flap endonuclease [Chloroflexota bacterium]
MELHLVDATYELFRAHFSPRPTVRGRDGQVLNGVSGLIETLLALVRDEGATHIGCATDRVIRSFRNDLFAGYKSDAGVPRELLDQFPIAERAIQALGFRLWSMVDLEADDALATAAARWGDEPSVDRILICTPDKDMAQCVRGTRVVLRDRRRRITYDEAGVRAKWGVPPASIADLLALVGDASDGYPGIPGWGLKTAAAVLSRYGTMAAIPRRGSQWDVPGIRGAAVLAARLAAMEDEAALYLDLATLRTNAPLPESAPSDLAWRGARREAFEALCDDLGLEDLRTRPHRWRPD